MSKIIQILTDQECNWLIEHFRITGPSDVGKFLSARDTLICLLMLDAGLRVGEVSLIYWLCIWSGESPSKSVLIPCCVGKGGRERYIPMSERLTKAVENYTIFARGRHQTHPHSVILTAYGGHYGLSIRQIQRIVTIAGEKAIGRKIHPHILRHTFATRLMRTTSTRIVQQLLGHKSLSSTQVYTHPNSLDLQKAIASL